MCIRDSFTLEPAYVRAVRKLFTDWFHEDIIYRGKRIVNWCPHCTTAVSYTHLDVYKRQALLVATVAATVSLMGVGAFACVLLPLPLTVTGLMPVSYTHLDLTPLTQGFKRLVEDYADTSDLVSDDGFFVCFPEPE